jgi:primosomal protein DnaI
MKSITIKPRLPKEIVASQQELLKKTLASKHVQSFMKQYQVDEHFIESHLGRFSMWVDEISLCDGCQGLFACRQKQTGHILNLTVEEGLLNNEVLKCHYLQEDEKQKKHMSQFVINDMSDGLFTLSFDQFNLETESHDYLQLFDRVSTWVNSPTDKGLFLHGSPGSGKTYLLSALANACAKKNKTIAFVHVPTLISKAKTYFDSLSSMDKMISSIKHADVVIFDDIGAESMTSWSRDELLFPILNYRLDFKKPTWFSSNERLETLKQHYETDQKGKTSTTKAIRMIERISALADPCLVAEDNRRKR